MVVNMRGAGVKAVIGKELRHARGKRLGQGLFSCSREEASLRWNEADQRRREARCQRGAVLALQPEASSTQCSTNEQFLDGWPAWSQRIKRRRRRVICRWSGHRRCGLKIPLRLRASGRFCRPSSTLRFRRTRLLPRTTPSPRLRQKLRFPPRTPRRPLWLSRHKQPTSRRGRPRSNPCRSIRRCSCPILRGAQAQTARQFHSR